MTILQPAYGRDYKSEAEALADFEANKDFLLNEFGNPYDGKPCHKSDFPPGLEVKIRHDSNRKFFFTSC